MYKSIEHALYRAFNVGELLYQKNNLSQLYRSPDWEQPGSDYSGNHLTPLERIHEDSKIYQLIRNDLSKQDFSVLRICYSRSSDTEEWRSDLGKISNVIKHNMGNVKFNPVIYEYTCIKHLTGQKLKSLYIKNASVRRNSERLKQILSDIRYQAERNAHESLSIHGIMK